MDTVRVAVVGAGVMGLSTALCISRLVPQCSVTVISDKFSPDTTSDVAAGILIPHVYPDTPIHKQKQWFRETFDHLFAIANSAEAGEAGVHLVSGWQIFRSIPTEETPFWADVVLGFRTMTEAELKKFPEHVFGQAFTTLKCEGSAYLPWLEKRVKESGGLMLTRRVEDLWELHPSFSIVVNCSGLGSRQLAGDLQTFPVRGQLLKVQAPWVKHFIRDGSGLTYVYPGASNVTLGGSRQKGDWNLSPDAEISRDILSRCCALEPSLRGAGDIQEKVGLRPFRAGIRLQADLLAQHGQRLPVVHHYGHGSGGFSVHWGTALEATRLLSECVQALRTPAPKSKLSGVQGPMLIYMDSGTCWDFESFAHKSTGGDNVWKSLNSLSATELPVMLTGCSRMSIILPVNNITWQSCDTSLLHLMEDKAQLLLEEFPLLLVEGTGEVTYGLGINSIAIRGQLCMGQTSLWLVVWLTAPKHF